MSGRDQAERVAIGKRLKEAREYIGFSGEEVRQRLGISWASFWAIEDGQRDITDAELARLAKLYQRPIGYFLGHEEAPDFRVTQPYIFPRSESLAEEDKVALAEFAEFLYWRKRSM